jgi:hypothetical protein
MMMNYHTPSKEKGQEIFFMCLILLIYLNPVCQGVGTRGNEDLELSTVWRLSPGIPIWILALRKKAMG